MIKVEKTYKGSTRGAVVLDAGASIHVPYEIRWKCEDCGAVQTVDFFYEKLSCSHPREALPFDQPFQYRLKCGGCGNQQKIMLKLVAILTQVTQ